MSLKKVHFLNELLETHKVPIAYKALRYAFNDSVFYKKSNAKEPEASTQMFIAFPGFLKPIFNNNQFKTKIITQKYRDSFGITIAPHITDISQYINAHFSKSSRTPIVKKMKRLENCFNIHYKVYYGEIDEETYKHIMDKTHAMLVRRFEQLKENNFVLKDWNKYFTALHPLINEQKASLFVIYNDNMPIQVSINFHYQKTYFAHIAAYDIDYAQFGLGNTAVYKQLEWCIKNNYNYLDMGNGDYEYKKRWCNYHYELETHIHYKSNSLKDNVLANKELNIIKIKNLLKELVNNKFYNEIKQAISANKFINKASPLSNYTTENLNNSEIPKNDFLQKIDLKATTSFQDIKKPLFDFLYITKDHINTVLIYKIENETDSFLIRGSVNSQKIMFNQQHKA